MMKHSSKVLYHLQYNIKYGKHNKIMDFNNKFQTRKRKLTGYKHSGTVYDCK